MRILLVLALAGLEAAAAGSPAALPGSSSPSTATTRPVELHGNVVCLAEEMHQSHQADLPTNHEHLYGFKTEAGKYYTLLRTRLSEALFAERRLQQEDLIITGRVFPNTQILDVIRLRSLRSGVLCDVLYYCNICSIETVAPGPCMCCQEPVKLLERPLKKSP